MGEPVETFCTEGVWRNRIQGREPLPGEFSTRDAALEIGRHEARIRGVVHVIHRADGTVEERARYPRRGQELPM